LFSVDYELYCRNTGGRGVVPRSYGSRHIETPAQPAY
jgi:hypothetical protein